MAVAFWNLFGAGAPGFLINLPIVSYFQHGSWLTPTHGHGALMGVDGMLAISFWGLDIGLMGMILITLMPVGFMQMAESFTNGFHAARDFSFYQRPMVNRLMWLRALRCGLMNCARVA